MHLPIHLSIKGRLCLLVGNGPFVQTLFPRLTAHGAHLRWVGLSPSPSKTEPLPGRVETRQNPYRQEDLDGVFLVVADTGDSEINARVTADARAAGILVMRGDQPLAGDFLLPDAPPTAAGSPGLCMPSAAKSGKVEKTGLPGTVYLIGAGPGDPGLLTVKGANCLRQSDVVLFDAIANPLLVSRYAPHAEKIDVGKRKGNYKFHQQDITRLMLDLARQGRSVARLKGGDPIIFGRGSEEARALCEAGIPFEIVPGVSCVTAVPAYAGIPITDREFGSSFGVYTIHKKDGAGLSEEQWRRMAQGPDTLILLMGKTVLAAVAQNLVLQGRPATTPVALITDGTTSRQKRFIGTLATIVEEVETNADGSEGPGLIVVGAVVSAFSGMEWFRPGTIEKFTGNTDHDAAFALLSRLMEGVAA